MNWKTIIVLGMATFGIGCEQTSNAPPAKDQATPAGKPENTAPLGTANQEDSQPADTDDRSLTTSQYIKLGLPKCDRPWSSSDMSRAAKVLTEIANRDARELPRHQSPKSGQVFARITADDNLDGLRKKSFPVTIRTGFALQFLHAAASIGKLYGTLAVEEGAASEETTELIGLTLRIATVLKGLSDEVLPTLDKNDPTSAARLKGLTQLTTALGPVLQGALNQALASKKLKPETRTRMLKYMEQTLPDLVKVIPPKAREEVLAKLKSLSERPEFAEHQQDIMPLLDKISQTLQEPPSNESDR